MVWDLDVYPIQTISELKFMQFTALAPLDIVHCFLPSNTPRTRRVSLLDFDARPSLYVLYNIAGMGHMIIFKESRWWKDDTLEIFYDDILLLHGVMYAVDSEGGCVTIDSNLNKVLAPAALNLRYRQNNRTKFLIKSAGELIQLYWNIYCVSFF